MEIVHFFRKDSMMSKEHINRRQFIQGTAAIAGAAVLSSCGSMETIVGSKKKTAEDQVTLGKTGIKLSRLGIGTGTRSGSVQRNLGQDDFNDLIHYAYDQGITYIDTADAYQTHTWIREAIKGLPREKLFIQSKIRAGGRIRGGGTPPSAMETLDRFRQEIGVDYIDSLLIHCQINGSWDEQNKQLMDELEEAKQKGIIRSHGVSCHSIVATAKAASLDWVDVNLVRINAQGQNIDSSAVEVFAQSSESDVPGVVEQLKIMRNNGHGIIGMKLVAEGAFTDIEQRKKSLTWVMQENIVDSVVLGFKNKEEIDEAIMHINNAFAEMA
jgi:aryl-alcohol dehydrogenase-like predicted oxidoreductase